MYRKILLFLYSTPNIVACLLGLLGLALFFFGLIRAYWFLIVIGMYGLGLVATPRNKKIDLDIAQELSVDDIKRALEELVKKVRGILNDAVYQKVENIKNIISDILPRTKDLRNSQYDLHVVEQTATEYLPETLQNYLNLPAAFARYHSGKSGKTPREILLEQLVIMEEEMQKILINIHENDTQALLARSRFLKQKFGKATQEQWF